jgi:hypothetical protein
MTGMACCYRLKGYEKSHSALNKLKTACQVGTELRAQKMYQKIKDDRYGDHWTTLSETSRNV